MRTRDDQTAAIRADQRLWRDLAAQVTPARYTEPGPMGDWSFGDLAGHLLGWREWTLMRLEAVARGEPQPTPPWPPELDAAVESDVDGINAWIHAQHAGRSPEQLVGDYAATYDRLIDVLARIPDAVLTDPAAIPWLEGTALIDLDFTGHLHDEHLPGVQEWLGAVQPN